MKKIKFALAMVGVFVSVSLQAATFQNITNWIGTGTNQAAFEIDWNNGTANDAFLWGYRWNGDATGEQMLDALVAGDPKLYAEVSNPTQYGTALFGLGLDHNGDQVFPLSPALTFGSNHLAYTDYGGVTDARTNVDAGDLWQEGWYYAGYWSYYVSDEARLGVDFTDWDYASTGMTERILADGDWDGWVFARDFADALPSDPFPGTHIVDTTPRPTLRSVHVFNGTDGANPAGTLVIQSNMLFGTASGGTNYNGVIFAVQPDGTSFTNVHAFANDDGAYPLGNLVSLEGTLYGTTRGAGAYGEGTVFSVEANGSNYAVLYDFSDASNLTNSDGATPQCGLTIGDNNTLFGLGQIGGQFGNGDIFRLSAIGGNFTNLHSFTALDTNYFNLDGYEPNIEMTYGNGVVYGAASFGGAQGSGDIFKMNADGTGFTVLYEFSALDSSNFDGAVPYGPLLLANGILYGTASQGAAFGSGCVFSIGTDGLHFTNFYSFSPVDNTGYNGDGSYPIGALFLDSNILYGVTQYGGTGGAGTVFQIDTNGLEFFSLAQFPRVKQGTNAVGANPAAGLIKVGDSLYGTTAGGGASGNGSVFAVDFPSPPVYLTASNNQLSVTWPVWGQKYALETSASLNSTNWQAVAASRSGSNFVFNATMQGKSAFFRLRK